MKHLIGYARNNTPVYVDLVRSDAAKRIAQHPFLLDLIAETLTRLTLKGAEMSVEQDMGRAVGYDFIVSTTDRDVIFYAQLTGDSAYTRFVKNGKPHAVQFITTIFRRSDDKDGGYELCDTWIGRLVPPRPGTLGETAKGRQYWANHAVVLDKQPIRSSTITKICPYAA